MFEKFNQLSSSYLKTIYIQKFEDSENEIVNKNQGKVLGSVIMYDVGKEGDLNFSQHIESDNTDQ